MKNITALAFLVIINCASIFSAPLFSQETEKGRYKFSVSPQAGIVYGQAFEYVYPVQGETKAELLSELKWDMKPVFYLGLQLDFEPADIMRSTGFFSSVSFKAGIPKDSGVMEDRDWMSTENSALTNFSSHTNRTNSFYALDAAVGISFPVKSILCIKPFLSGSWMRFSFTGRDGYGSYPGGNVSFLGKEVISYKQDWLLFSSGISAAVKVFSRLTFELSFKISPYTYCADVDEHQLTNTEYRDITTWGLYLEPSFSMAYSVKRVDFTLNAAFRKIGNTSGVIYLNEKNTGFQLSQNKGGAGLSLLDTRFLVKVRLF